MIKEIKNAIPKNGIEEIYGLYSERQQLIKNGNKGIYTGTTFLEQDTGKIFTYNEDTNTWYELKQGGGGMIYENATVEQDGLMSKEDKAKLDGVAENANNYTHPTKHPATIITEDADNRFCTDAEKTKWNGKQDEIVAQNAIADLLAEADLPTVVSTVNSVLATLRTVGIIKNS